MKFSLLQLSLHILPSVHRLVQFSISGSLLLQQMFGVVDMEPRVCVTAGASWTTSCIHVFPPATFSNRLLPEAASVHLKPQGHVL